jgi:hypothetical protein
MTVRAGQNCKDWTARTARTARIGPTGQDRMTAWTGIAGTDSQTRIARQDSEGEMARKGPPGTEYQDKDCQEKTARKGMPGKDCQQKQLGKNCILLKIFPSPGANFQKLHFFLSTLLKPSVI